MAAQSIGQLEAAMAEYQGAGAARAFWMGRVGLYAVMRALGVRAGDRVGICAYTCLGAVESVTRLGARPVFLDIDRRLNIAPASLEGLAEPIKVLIVQHTFGVPGPMDAYLAWSRARGVPVIEDCCQAPGATWDGRKMGTFGVAGVFSLEWSKPFSTGLGGIVTFPDTALAREVDRVVEAEGSTPGPAAAYGLALQRALHKRLVTPRTRDMLRKVYRAVRRGGTTGVQDVYQALPTTAAGFLKRLPTVQARAALREFVHWRDAALPARRAAAALLKKRLVEAGLSVLDPDPRAGPVYLRIPIWVRNKPLALARAAQERIDIGGWFATPADPIRGPALDAIGYRPADCPVAEEAFASVVTLPGYPAPPSEHLERAIEILRASMEDEKVRK